MITVRKHGEGHLWAKQRRVGDIAAGAEGKVGLRKGDVTTSQHGRHAGRWTNVYRR